MAGQPNPEFLRRAIALATRNVITAAGGPFGAVVVRDGKIVGEGANSVTSTNDPTAHAEVNAIRAATKALRTFTLGGCELYTSCEPCPMCLAAAYWARLDAVYYGASAADAARAGFDDAMGRRKKPSLRSDRAQKRPARIERQHRLGYVRANQSVEIRLRIRDVGVPVHVPEAEIGEPQPGGRTLERRPCALDA